MTRPALSRTSTTALLIALAVSALVAQQAPAPAEADTAPADAPHRVLVAFGTHLAPEKARLVAALRRVAELLPDVAFDLSLGGTVGTGTAGRAAPADDTDADARVRVIDYADYDRLDRYDAVVHHGGAGVAQAALAAARPAVVIPVDYDQPDVAARLVHHDLADRLDDRVLRVGSAGAERLAGAVRRALAPSAARRAALERFRDACARNDGAVAAADVIQQALTTSRPVAGSATGAPA